MCRRTLYNIRSVNGMLEDNQAFTTISDQDLIDHIKAIKQDTPDSGYNMMKGVLQARGIHISIPHIQQSLHRHAPYFNTRCQLSV